MSKNDTNRGKKYTSSTGITISPAHAATLKNVRIIQKHLVYVIGLSSNLANKEVSFL